MCGTTSLTHINFTVNVKLYEHPSLFYLFYRLKTLTLCVARVDMKNSKYTSSPNSSQRELVRRSRLSCLVSEEEMRIIDSYLKKYKITNKSRWMRQTLLSSIHKGLEEDYPTLFNEHEMRR